MGIQKDAGELLVYIYNQYTANNTWIQSKDIIEETGWEAGRINRAIDYLKDLGLIKINLYIGNTEGVYNFGIQGLTPSGIGIIENEEQFEKTFGFEIGIPGVLKFSWTRRKK